MIPEPHVEPYSGRVKVAVWLLALSPWFAYIGVVLL